MVNLLYYNFNSLFSLLQNFYLSWLLIELCFSLIFFSLFFFRIHKWSSNISNRHHKHFPFHGLHFATSLTVLTPVLCFHTTSFNYGAKVVRDVDPTCRCHQSNIMPDSIFSVNNAQCVTCGYACCYCIVIFLFFRFFYCFFCVCKCVSVCVCLGVISGLLLFVETRCPVFSLLQ